MTRTTRRSSTLSRLAVALLLANALSGVPSAGAYYSGGGKDVDKGNDCLIGYDNLDQDQVTEDGKKQVVPCTDCDPACDLDLVTTANGSCLFKVGICINQSGVEGCDPPSALDKATAKGKVKGVKGASGKIEIDTSLLLEGSACGSLVDVTVPVKETKKAAKDGKFSFNLSALVKKNKTEDTPKRKDSDKITYLCQPRPEGEACPGTTTTTTTIPPQPNVFSFRTGTPTGVCGSVRRGGAAGSVVKNLNCGGLNVGGGNSTVAEGPTPDNAETQMNVACTGSSCAVSGRTAADTGDPTTCSDTGCPFGPWLPIANSGTSTCVRNTFSSPASGTLDTDAGTFTGSFPLTSRVYLTANSSQPCPLCIGGTPGVTDSGTCDPAWTSGAGPSPDAGAACTPVNSTGNTHDCTPPPAVALDPFAVNLDPITTEASSFSDAAGLFCPNQVNGGAFGCAGTGNENAICPGGNTPPVPDYVDENGVAAGPLALDTPANATLASVFCIPDPGNFVIASAANLPGPGATSLPGTFELTFVP